MYLPMHHTISVVNLATNQRPHARLRSVCLVCDECIFVLRIQINLATAFARWEIPLVCCSCCKHQRQTLGCLPPVPESH